MNKLLLLISLLIGLPNAYSADTTAFAPALFIHAGINRSAFNQKVIEQRSYPYLDLEYQVSPALSAVLHSSRINAYTNNILIPRMLIASAGPGRNIPDTLYNVESKEQSIITVATLKFKFRLAHNKNMMAYCAPQMGFMFANSTYSRHNNVYHTDYSIKETLYSYGFDLGTEHRISSDNNFRFCTGLGLLIGNMEPKDPYNYTSKIDTRLVIYNISIGLKYILYTAK